MLNFLLKDYLPAERDYLVSGFKFGFKIGFIGTCPGYRSKNSLSVDQLPQETLALVDADRKLGRILGPFDSPPFVNLQVSPLAIVPKSTPGVFRLIHNLSAPYNKLSINAGIPDSEASVTYASVLEVMDFLVAIGPEAYMCKVDVKSAFRTVPIHYSDFPLMGFQLQGKFYINTSLAMGGRSSCRIFERFASALHWYCQKKLHIYYISHLIDDFCFVERTQSLCEQVLITFLALAKAVGLPLADDKTVFPCQTLTYLGVELDARQQFARLPHDKLVAYIAQIDDCLACEHISLHDLRIIIGRLNWATSLIESGKSFLRGLINLTIGLHNPSHEIQLNDQAKLDLIMWKEFLINYNGYCFWSERQLSLSQPVRIYTDASLKACGGVCGQKWFCVPFPSSWSHLHISVLELYPIWVALNLLIDQLGHRKVICVCDNIAVVEVINRKSCRDPALMFFMRLIAKLVLLNGISLSSTYIRSEDNVIPDKISRFLLSQVDKISTGLEDSPLQVPEPILPINYKIPCRSSLGTA